MAHGKFILVIDCMDGRVQPLSRAIVDKHFGPDYLVDNVALAGPDGLLAIADANLPSAGPITPTNTIIEAIQKEIAISLDKHGAFGVVLIGHQDCAGNPVEEAQHLADIKKSVDWIKRTMQNQGLPAMPVLGAYAFMADDGWSYRLAE